MRSTLKLVYTVRTVHLLFLLMMFFSPSILAHAVDGDAEARSLKMNVVKVRTTLDTDSVMPGVGFIAGERDNNLYIVTANHVVRCVEDGCSNVRTKSVEVKFSSNQGEWIKATLLDTRLDAKDLAVIRVAKPTGFTWIRDCLAMETGELRPTQVWFVGKDDQDDPWYVPAQPGAINNGPNTESKIEIDINTVRAGTSGAPLITSTGIIGMIVQAADASAWALHITPIKQAFELWHHPWDLRPSNLQSNQLGVENAQLKVSLNAIQVLEDGSAGSTRWEFEVGVTPVSGGNLNPGSQILLPEALLRDGRTVTIGRSTIIKLQPSQQLDIKIIGNKVGTDGMKAVGGITLKWEEVVAGNGLIDIRAQVPNKPRKGNFIFHFTVQLAEPLMPTNRVSPPTSSTVPSVLVVDSKGNEASMGQIVVALEILKTEKKIRLDIHPATTDPSVNDILADKKPDLIIIHVHAFKRETATTTDPLLTDDTPTVDFIREVNQVSETTKFLVYSQVFANPGVGDKWIDRLEVLNGDKIQGDWFPAKFIKRIETIGFPHSDHLETRQKVEIRERVSKMLGLN
jgi:hypothetical protein